MRAFMSRRDGLSLGLVALLASPGFAADPSSGAGAWAASCARCHRDPVRLLPALPAPDDVPGNARLDRYLADHHARDAATRAAILAWLRDQASQ